MNDISFEYEIIDLLKNIGIDYYDFTPFQKQTIIDGMIEIFNSSDMMEEAEKESYDNGYTDGKSNGYEQRDIEAQQEIDDAYDKGFEQGNKDGYEDGYNEGYKDARDTFEDINIE